MRGTLNLLTYLPKNSLRMMVDRDHVTLSGEVAWEYQQDAAATVVRWLAGVTNVSNHTIVKPLALTAVRSQIDEVRRQSVADSLAGGMSMCEAVR